MIKKLVTLLLTALLLVSLLPAATAADGESVLTELGHKNTNTVSITGTKRNVILLVPYSYAGDTIDLTTGLIINYDPNIYKNVVASTAVATVDGPAVTLTVTYSHIGDEDDATKFATDYTITVMRTTPVPPAFTGVIETDVTAPGLLNFSYLDIPSKYTANDGEPMGSISVTGSNPTFGTLKLTGAAYTFGTTVPVDSLRNLTFTASQPGVVSYDIKAYAGSDTTTPIGNVVVTIRAYSVPKINSAITDTVSKGTVMTFTESYFTSHVTMYGMPLVSVDITPGDLAFGTWYLGAKPFTTATNVPAEQLATLTFVANSAGNAGFNWRVSNKAGFSAVGTGTITITSPSLALTPYTSGTTILKGNTWPVLTGHFIYTPNTAALSYIKITSIPAAADGYLYLTNALPKNDVYGYPAIAANTPLKVNAVIPASHIDYLRMSTVRTSKADQVVFKWTATADNKVSTAVWGEAVTYTVRFIGGGTLDYATDMNTPIKLTTADINTLFTNRTGMALSYVTFTIPEKSAGTLYLNYDLTTKKGTAVAASTKYYLNKNPNLANISFVPAADYTGTAVITYNAYAENGYYLTGKLNIEVRNSPGGVLNLVTDKNQPLPLDAAAFSACFQAATGKPLSYVRLSVPHTSYGHLYYDYQVNGQSSGTISGSTVFYAYEAPYLSLVTYVPAKDYTGSFSISFTGYTEQGSAYYGKINVTVTDSPGGIVTYSMAQNSLVRLSGNDFSNEFIGVTGSVLNTVSFTPPTATSGTLYYQYSAETQKGTKVTAAVKYFDGKSPDISDLTFIPAKDFVGTVVIPFTATTSTGLTYSGKLKLVVTESSQTISLLSEGGTPVVMPAVSFMYAFSNLSGGETLSYLTFEQPSPSYGKLYYNYLSASSYDSAVTADTKYYVMEAPYLSYVYFVPSGSYNGTFTFNYTGYTDSGAAYTGKVKITVTNTIQGALSYETNSETPVTFRASDFVAAFDEGTLSHVVFTLPYTSYGTLYYGYASSSDYDFVVSATSRYYVNSSPYLSGVTFVPNRGFTGSLAIGYTAYSTTGTTDSGSVIIMVNSSEIDTITYNTPSGLPVQLNAEDFNTAFLSRTGSSLNYVRFTLPTASVGKLYHGYDSPGAYASTVTASTKYYRMYSPLLSDITFVPAAGFTGAATFSYTGYTIAGTAYAGKVIINVGSDAPFIDIDGFAWASDAISFLYRAGVVTGQGNNLFNPASPMSRGDFVLMVTRAFDITVTTDLAADNFPDVPAGSYYYDAIAAAKAYGIVTGTNGKFSPALAISRQDAMVIIKRALDVEGIAIAPGTAANIAGFSDAKNVSEYAMPAVSSLVKAGIINGSGGALRPKDIISRAEMAVILYRVLTL
jgi:hypothetical protein